MSLTKRIENAANQIENDLLQLKNIITYEQNFSKTHSSDGTPRTSPISPSIHTNNMKKRYEFPTAIVLGTVTGLTMIVLEYFMICR